MKLLLVPPATGTTQITHNYFAARDRFRHCIEERQGKWEAVPIAAHGPDRTPLSIDVGRIGSPHASTVMVVSSGLHGAEGAFGSAAQAAWLASSPTLSQLPNHVAILFLHALNPFGFAWNRRANDANIDLNRNFLVPGEEYRGSPPLYGRFLAEFDPTSRPSRHKPPLLLKSLISLWRHGMKELRHSLPVGQYDYPTGLFFGGKGPSETQVILERKLAEWVGPATFAAHLDFHTGLGPWAGQKLLLDHSTSQEVSWWTAHFDKENVEAAESAITSYPTRGSFGPWLKARLPHVCYFYATAEYGTYPPLQVITALLNETRAFHHGLDNPRYAWTREVLKETFAPRSPLWRRRATTRALQTMEKCLAALKRQALASKPCLPASLSARMQG